MSHASYPHGSIRRDVRYVLCRGDRDNGHVAAAEQPAIDAEHESKDVPEDYTLTADRRLRETPVPRGEESKADDRYRHEGRYDRRRDDRKKTSAQQRPASVKSTRTGKRRGSIVPRNGSAPPMLMKIKANMFVAIAGIAPGLEHHGHRDHGRAPVTTLMALLTKKTAASMSDCGTDMRSPSVWERPDAAIPAATLWRERFDDPAFGDSAAAFASFAQRTEFCCEFLEISQLLFDGCEVSVGDPVDLIAGTAFL